MSHRRRHCRAHIFLVPALCFCLLASGCSTMRAVPVSAATGETGTRTVHPGDFVEVTLRDGQVKTFKVTALTGDSISGAGQLAAYKDITTLRVRTFSTGKTLGLAGGVVAAAAAVLVALALIAGGGAVSQ